MLLQEWFYILKEKTGGKINNLEKELIEDIEEDLIGWSEFITNDDREEVIMHRDEIRNKIALLKELGR